MRYEAEQAVAFAKRISGMGFTVYLAKSGTYGFITDATEKHVLLFEFNGLHDSLSGSYGPPSKQCGTGWRMDETPGTLKTTEEITNALNAQPPAWAGKGWRYLSTVAQYLAEYGPSSQFTKYTGP